MEPTRRNFLAAGAGAMAAAQALRAAPLTAKEVLERIQKNVGVPWRAETVDTIKSGSLDTPISGIATTMMATLDVCQKAAAAGRNFVITHEPTFYAHEDKTETLKDDPVYRFKQDFLDKHSMVVMRFHDHWHAHRPDGIFTGMTQELGWTKNVDPQNPRQFLFDGITLSDLAGQIKGKLGVKAMRVVGDPKLPLRRVAANWGYAGGVRGFTRMDIDALIVGESREWEMVEYAADAITSGQKKALIVLGHIPSEQGGMKYCAEWLKGFITEVPVEFVAAAEPFWTPGG
jgi:putative NIF3 family GTP cyclohydrolase 1 type 2